MYGGEFRKISEKLEEILRIVRRRFREFKPARSILIHGGNMSLGITAGGALLTVQLIPLPSGAVFDSPADLELTSDDPNVVIAANPTDTTGTLFDVSTPASDTATSANLDATGLAGGVQIEGTALLTITPAAAQAATSIGIVAAPLAAPAALRRTAPAASGVRTAPAATRPNR
jgi:hypothetical protein